MILTAVWNPSFAPSMKASYTFTFFLTPASMNPTMIVMSRMLATDVLTRSTCSLLIVLNPHITPATSKLAPPRVSNIVRLTRLIL